MARANRHYVPNREKVNGKRIIEWADHFELREESVSYSGHFPAKKSPF